MSRSVPPPKGMCRKCGELIRHNQTAVYPVQGYEEDRVQGGANKIMHRQRIDGYIWHKLCFEEIVRRRNGEQGALLDG